jgi:hypothetical protein
MFVNYSLGNSRPTCNAYNAPLTASLILTTTTEVLAVACSGSKQEAVDSRTFVVSGGGHVAVSLSIDGDDFTPENFVNVEGKILLAVARAAAVHPLRVNMNANVARRLLELSLQIMARSPEDAALVRETLFKADVAKELEIQGLKVKVHYVCT